MYYSGTISSYTQKAYGSDIATPSLRPGKICVCPGKIHVESLGQRAVN